MLIVRPCGLDQLFHPRQRDRSFANACARSKTQRTVGQRAHQVRRRTFALNAELTRLVIGNLMH